jgi:hypothetical protein
MKEDWWKKVRFSPEEGRSQGQENQGSFYYYIEVVNFRISPRKHRKKGSRKSREPEMALWPGRVLVLTP